MWKEEAGFRRAGARVGHLLTLRQRGKMIQQGWIRRVFILRNVSYPTVIDVINRWMSAPVHLVLFFPSCGPRGSCPWFGW
jgi:hypothetical protein